MVMSIIIGVDIKIIIKPKFTMITFKIRFIRLKAGSLIIKELNNLDLIYLPYP